MVGKHRETTESPEAWWIPTLETGAIFDTLFLNFMIFHDVTNETPLFQFHIARV
jgi:hypothetical protein